MVCVGIDVAKDKHDCCILDSDGTVRADCFTIPNNSDGFKRLLQTIQDCTQKSDKIKVGLEATGHYSYNILGFLLDNGLPTYIQSTGKKYTDHAATLRIWAKRQKTERKSTPGIPDYTFKEGESL